MAVPNHAGVPGINMWQSSSWKEPSTKERDRITIILSQLTAFI